MKRMAFVAGLAAALVCAVAPVAVAAGAPAQPSSPAAPSTPAVPGTPGGSGGEATPGTPTVPTDPVPPPAPAPFAQHIVWGCLTKDATPAGASMRVIWGNREMRTALAGAGTFTVGIDAGTSVRRGWSWQRNSWPASRISRTSRSAGSGVAGLQAGDIVTAFITARSGTAAAALPAADTILDFGRYGRSRSCAVRSAR